MPTRGPGPLGVAELSTTRLLPTGGQIFEGKASEAVRKDMAATPVIKCGFGMKALNTIIGRYPDNRVFTDWILL